MAISEDLPDLGTFDTERFDRIKENHLIHYGAGWIPPVIRGGQGALLYGDKGQRLIDLTSGQLSSWLGQ